MISSLRFQLTPFLSLLFALAILHPTNHFLDGLVFYLLASYKSAVMHRAKSRWALVNDVTLQLIKDLDCNCVQVFKLLQ